jgi:hypothetical protein
VRAQRALCIGVLTLAIIAPELVRAQTLEAFAPADSRTEIVHVRRGETLTGLLARRGVPPADAKDAAAAIQRLWNPRELKNEQEITLDFGQGFLASVQIEAGPDRILSAERRSDGHFKASAETRALARVPRQAMGVIKTSLYQAAVDAHVPPPLLSEMVRAFSYDVDFQREVQPGDSFELVYERMADSSGRTVAAGDLVYASMTLSGKALRMFRTVPIPPSISTAKAKASERRSCAPRSTARG